MLPLGWEDKRAFSLAPGADFAAQMTNPLRGVEHDRAKRTETRGLDLAAPIIVPSDSYAEIAPPRMAGAAEEQSVDTAAKETDSEERVSEG